MTDALRVAVGSVLPLEVLDLGEEGGDRAADHSRAAVHVSTR